MFYFKIDKRNIYKGSFYIVIKFSEKELIEHEENNAKLEIKVSQQKEPLKTKDINRINFVPDYPEKIPLEKFSKKYIVFDNLDDYEFEYELFNEEDPTFFKICDGDNEDDNFIAKWVRSQTIYTKTSYFIVFPDKCISSNNIKLLSNITKNNYFYFQTMNTTFLCEELLIESKTQECEEILKLWGYELKNLEKLTLLWPPSSYLEDTMMIKSDNVYVRTDFDLKVYTNIDSEPKNIKSLNNGVSKISFTSELKIGVMDSEIKYKRYKTTESGYEHINVELIKTKKYDVPNIFLSFLFNKYGVTFLGKGMSMLLTPNTEIRNYSSGYLVERIRPKEINILSGELLLNNILAHYKTVEIFKWKDFDDVIDINEIALNYFQSCEISGQINSAVKRFIKNGLI
jgi:hypothetical protein